MSTTHKQTYHLSSTGGTLAISGSQSEVGATEQTIDSTFAASTTDSLLSIAFTASNLQSIALVSDKNLTIETNSASSPTNTINLKAGTPFVWSKSAAYFANPFTANVTAFYITCTGAARLRGRILVS